MYHYLHMAQKNFRTYLREEEVWTKKYFYVLRPLLACRWVEADRGAVPMEFERLVETSDLPEEALKAIATLLQEKRAGAELRRGPRVPVLNEFIESEFARLEAARMPRCPPEVEVNQLSKVLRESLIEVWGVQLGAG